MSCQSITISPNVSGGIPVFYNTNVPVSNLFDYLKVGDSLEDFLSDFPSVSKDQALTVLSMAENIITVNTGVGEAVA